MIAALLGTGAVADAFLAAFQLVNVVRRLLSGGALNAALVPAWLRRARHRWRGGRGRLRRTRARHHQRRADRGLTVLIGLLMPLVITVLAPGFAGHETLQLAVRTPG